MDRFLGGNGWVQLRWLNIVIDTAVIVKSDTISSCIQMTICLSSMLSTQASQDS